MAVTVALSLLLMLLLSIVSSLIVPGGLFTRMLGHAVVTRDGAEIGRMLSLARVLVAWAPAIAWLLYLATSPKVQGFVPTPPNPSARHDGDLWRTRDWRHLHHRAAVAGPARLAARHPGGPALGYEATMARRSRYRRSTFAFLTSASLHAMLAVAVILIASMPAKDPPTSMAYTVAVAVPAAEAPGTKSSDQPLVAEERDADIDPSPDPSSKDGLDIDLDKLRARREALFPFLTTDMDFLDRVSDQVHGDPERLALPSAVKPDSAPKLRPLQLSDTEIQEIVDGAWSRRARWTAFARLAELIRTYDPDHGQVPVVLRAYLDQNLLQLFCDSGTRVPRLWVMLENAADHIDFVEFIGAFTRDYPSSVATTELLFLLDKLAQASRDALLLLASIDPERELTARENKDRSEFVVALQRHYRERLEHRQLSSADDIKAWYDRVRLQILSDRHRHVSQWVPYGRCSLPRRGDTFRAGRYGRSHSPVAGHPAGLARRVR